GGASLPPAVAAAIPPSSQAPPAGSAVPSTLVSTSAVAAGENGAAHEDDDAPELEVREIEIPKNSRRRSQMNLTLLDGTTIKLPSGRKRPAKADAGEPSSDRQVTAAEMVAALRAAARESDA